MDPLFNISIVSPYKTYFRRNAPTEMFTPPLKIDQHQQEHFDYRIDPALSPLSLLPRAVDPTGASPDPAQLSRNKNRIRT